MRRGIGCTCVTGSPRVRYQLSAVHIKCDRSPSTTRSLRVARTPLFPLSLARSFSLSFSIFLSGSFFPSAPPVLYSTWPAGISPFRAEIPSFDSFTTTTTSVISNNVPAGGSFFNRHSNPEHAGEILVRVCTLRTRRS